MTDNTSIQLKASAVPEFSEFENMAWAIIHQKLRSSGIHQDKWAMAHDELISEAGIIFLHAVETFQDDKGAEFPTYLYGQLEYRLSNHIYRKLKHLFAGGEGSQMALEDLPESILIEDDLQGRKGIDNDKAAVINYIYKSAYLKWSADKCGFLFFVYAYDEVGVYNGYLKPFIADAKDYFDEIGVSVPEDASLLNEKTVVDDVAHQMQVYWDKHPKRPNMINNVRKTIDYALKNKLGA